MDFKGRSCVDNIFCLKHTVKSLAVGQKTHLLFIDLRKAYDCIPHMTLLKTLEDTQIQNTIIGAIKELNRESKIKIKVQSKKKSGGFFITKGLRQGCCIYQIYFKICVERSLKV